MIKEIKKKYDSLPLTAKASMWFFVCSFMQRGISVITTPIFTRLLSVEEYGQFSVFNSWLGIVTVFVTLRLYYGVFSQGLVKFESDRNKYVSSIHGLLIALTCIWIIIYLIFHSFWNSLLSLTTAQMLSMLLMIWTTGVFNLWAAEQRVDLSYKKLVIVTIIASILKPGIGIILVKSFADKVTARIVGLAAVELVVYTPLFLSQVKRDRKLFSKWYWKYSVRLNVPLVPHYLSQTVLSSADRIMIERYIGTGEAGIYGLAYSISMFTALASNALEQTISPWIYKKIKAKGEKDINKYAIGTLILMGGIILLFIAFAPEVVKLFAPPSYYEAIWIIPSVSMSVYFMYMYSLFASFEFYYEQTGFISIGTMISALLNVILNALFIPMFGTYAAGYTTLFCYIAYASGHYIFMRKILCDNNYQFKVYDIKMIAIISIGFVCIGFALMAFYENPVVRYGLICLMLILLMIFRNKISHLVKDLVSAKRVQ